MTKRVEATKLAHMATRPGMEQPIRSKVLEENQKVAEWFLVGLRFEVILKFV